MTVGRVKGGRYFVENFKCARNYARAKRVGASSYYYEWIQTIFYVDDVDTLKR